MLNSWMVANQCFRQSETNLTDQFLMRRTLESQARRKYRSFGAVTHLKPESIRHPSGQKGHDSAFVDHATADAVVAWIACAITVPNALSSLRLACHL